MNPPEICIIGDNCVDLYPQQEKKYAGGNAVNTAVAVKRNGIECGYLGIVGNDENGKRIIDALQKEAIDCQRLRQQEGNTAWTKVLLDEGDRIFIEDSLEVQKEWDLVKKDYQYLDKFNWVHHTIFSNWNLEGKNKIQNYERTILKQVSTIRDRALNISIDFSEKFDIDLIVSLGPLVEVGIFSRPGIPDSEIPQTLQTLHDLGFGLVVVTMGERGSAAYDGQEVFRQDAVPVEVIDTLGVGDAFIGAFLAQYVVNSSVRISLKLAAEYSAHYCTVEGAF